LSAARSHKTEFPITCIIKLFYNHSNVLIALGSTSIFQYFWVNLPLN